MRLFVEKRTYTITCLMSSLLMKSSQMKEKRENKIPIGSTKTLRGDRQTQMLDLGHSAVMVITYMWWLIFTVKFNCL